MKTILEWANELPEDVSGAFVSNTVKRRRLNVAPSLYNAISIAFMWSETKQGKEYWASVRLWSRKQQGTCPPLPKKLP